MDGGESKMLLQRTGKSPINAETPTHILLEHDVTPIENFYVRCHGSEPNLKWSTHTIGLYDETQLVHELSMGELKASFPQQTIRATIVCDGNRRKELNMIKRTNGFDWGCNALSTGIFDGVCLKSILLRFFDKKKLEAGRYVAFDSADSLANGHYGTSIPLAPILSEDLQVLIATGMNGQKLTKQHGFPVRTIIPGCVGGRTVKWLTKIMITEHGCNGHYHLEDNSVFPPDVSTTALMSKTVYQHLQDPAGKTANPEHPFILYELNLNSAILSPGHGEVISTKGKLSEDVTFEGYAYDGGGRKITRVELTLDEGENWIQCQVKYPDDYVPERGCRYYVLCKWKVSLPIWRLAACKSISVRAWNQSANTQPQKHTWNILGMMNNAWYTIHVNRFSAHALQLLHPVSTDHMEPKGWMEPEYPVSAYTERFIPPAMYTREDVSHHNRISDSWVIIDKKVYDLTDFMNLHPGGRASISTHAGQDITTLFYDIHSEDAHVLKSAYVIGTVVDDEGEAEQPKKARHPLLGRKHPRVTPEGHEIELSSFKWSTVSLKEKVIITHDTRRFVFAFSSPDKRMWLPWAKHINLGIELSDRMVVRPYTPVKPILNVEDNGTFELVIKIYFPTDERPGGEMTQMLEKLVVGDTIKVKGPEGVLWYLGNGQFSIHGHFFFCNRMNFIVGGTGITPALAVMRAITLAEKHKLAVLKPQIRLVFANKTKDDILCLDELRELLDAYEDVQLCHVISAADKMETSTEPRVSYESGLINTAILKKHVLQPDEGSACFICGPPAMIAQAVLPGLFELGFDDDQIFEF